MSSSANNHSESSSGPEQPQQRKRISLVVAVVGAVFGIVATTALVTTLLLGGSDSSSEPAPAATTAPIPEPAATAATAPETSPPTTAAPDVDPEIELLLDAAEDGIPLIVSDFRWQNPEVYSEYTRVAASMPSAEDVDCSFFSSDAWDRHEAASLKVGAVSEAARVEIDALADEVSALGLNDGEVGERAFLIHNVLRHDAIYDLQRIASGRIDKGNVSGLGGLLLRCEQSG